MSNTNNFGWALEQLKNGLRVRRKGWNGNGIFLELQVPDDKSKMTQPFIFIDTTGLQTDNPNAPKGRVPWFASQTDLLCEDWEILEDSDDGFCSVFQVIRPDGTNSSYHPKTKLESDTLKKLTQRERWDLLEKWRKESSLDSFIRRNGK